MGRYSTFIETIYGSIYGSITPYGARLWRESAARREKHLTRDVIRAAGRSTSLPRAGARCRIRLEPDRSRDQTGHVASSECDAPWGTAGALCMGREEAACMHARLSQLPHYLSNVVGAQPGGGWPRHI